MEPAPPPASPPKREIPQPPKTTDAELLELHRELQDALSRYGVGRYTLALQYDLEKRLARDLGVDLTDVVAVDRMLAEIHLRAYPVKGRPAMLTPFAALEPLDQGC